MLDKQQGDDMDKNGFVAIDSDTVEWPAYVPVPPGRVTGGQPSTSTVALDSPKNQMGLWRVTPGAFTTDHEGYIEFIYVISGRGRLVGEDGSVCELQANSTLILPEGWKGLWEVDSTITKVFTIVTV